jgi:hypothetical protein
VADLGSRSGSQWPQVTSGFFTSRRPKRQRRLLRLARKRGLHLQAELGLSE